MEKVGILLERLRDTSKPKNEDLVLVCRMDNSCETSIRYRSIFYLDDG